MNADPPISLEATDTAPGAAGLLKLRRISSSDRRILLVSAGTVASRLLAKLAQLAFLVVAARLLSVDDFARYSYLLVLAVTFSMLADTGVALAATREISSERRTPAEAFWSSAPVIGLGATLALTAVLVFGLVDSGPGSSGVPLLLACLFVALNTWFNFAASALRGVGRQVYEAVLQGSGAVFFVAAAAAALALDGGLVTVLAILVLKEALSFTLAMVGLARDVGAPRRWTPGLWRLLLRIGIQIGLASTGLALVTRIPTFVLGNSGSTTEFAWYSAAQRLGDGVLVLATASGFALLPSLTLLFVSERPRAWTLLRRLLLAAAGGGVVLGALAVVFAPTIVTLAYGSDFADAADPARAVMAAAPAYAIVGIGWYALVALGRERQLLVLATASAGCSLVLSLAVIPAGGDVAAGLAYGGAAAAMALAILVCVVGARDRNTRFPRSQRGIRDQDRGSPE